MKRYLVHVQVVCCMCVQAAFAQQVPQQGNEIRDLNHNGQVDVYEDPSQPVEDRVEDLLEQMTLQEKAGQMFNAISRGGREETLIGDSRIHNMSLPEAATAKELLTRHNTLQELAEGTRLGIPLIFYSDPLHGERSNVQGEGRYFSRWPSELGFAAIGNPEVVQEYADIARQEYRAVGIRLALHPMADLATEPRWYRVYTTFGEDADLSARLTKAYVTGFQGERLGRDSVLCMTKHFPGGGPQKDGWDSHFPTGKEQVYPGGMFDYHLKPFTEGALPARTAQLMLYYGVPKGITKEQVAFGFNKEIVTDLLRDRLGFDGVVCTDWALVSDNPAKPASAWGVEDLSAKSRVKKILDAGVDMLGGEECTHLIVELVQEGSVTEDRIDESVRRILRDKFRIGLFDDPYLDESALEVFENHEFKDKGRAAQRKSLVLCKNDENILPLARGAKIYVRGFSPTALDSYAEVVETPEEADVIIFKFDTPYTPVKDPKYFLERIFHQGRLDFPDKEKEEILELLRTRPAVSIMKMLRPAVVPEINEASKAMIVDFSCEDEILAELIFGMFKPTGKLPVEIPSSVEAVEAQLEDVPHDSEMPLYRFGHGLSYR